jgi:hypothetical protein
LFVRFLCILVDELKENARVLKTDIDTISSRSSRSSRRTKPVSYAEDEDDDELFESVINKINFPSNISKLIFVVVHVLLFCVCFRLNIMYM